MMCIITLSFLYREKPYGQPTQDKTMHGQSEQNPTRGNEIITKNAQSRNLEFCHLHTPREHDAPMLYLMHEGNTNRGYVFG